jgi:antitoxin (DNA-binding transcriptional repressor) of toxin-antitoxin stability system
MNPADILHRAAAKLREEATAAWGKLCLPPWQYGNSWAGTHAVLCQDGHPIVEIVPHRSYRKRSSTLVSPASWLWPTRSSASQPASPTRGRDRAEVPPI